MDREIFFTAIGEFLITLHKDTILGFTRVQLFPCKLLTWLLQYILLCILHIILYVAPFSPQKNENLFITFLSHIFLFFFFPGCSTYNTAIAFLVVLLLSSANLQKFCCRGKTSRITLIITDGISFISVWQHFIWKHKKTCFIILQSNLMWNTITVCRLPKVFRSLWWNEFKQTEACFLYLSWHTICANWH